MVPERHPRVRISRLLVFAVKLCSTVQAVRYCINSKVMNAGIQCPTGGTPATCAVNTKHCCLHGNKCLSLDTTPKHTCPFDPLQPPESNNNRVLMGHVNIVRHVTSSLQCADLCFRHAWCVGYNYEMAQNHDKRVCELLSVRGGDAYRPGFAFNIFDHNKAKKAWLQNICTSPN